MAKFLTTSGITHEVENIIKEAKKKLVLISPYVQINKMLLERLQNASDKSVKIIFIYGKSELNKIEKNQLESIENLKLYFYPNLHAKCYFNEKKMVITSMNLYDFSEKNNREMGLLIQKVDDLEIFMDAINEAVSIVKSAEEKLKVKQGINIFPLKEEDFQTIHTLLEKEYIHCKFNSTSTYVFCTDFFPFANVMIREGLELRFNWGLYSKNLLEKKIKAISLATLVYNYNIEVGADINGTTRIKFLTSNAFDLNVLLNDYSIIVKRINEATEKVSNKTRNYF